MNHEEEMKRAFFGRGAEHDVNPSRHGKLASASWRGVEFQVQAAPENSKFTETLREHESGNGFTLTTLDAGSAFAMAEKMAFSGINYSIQLSGVKGGDWVVIVTEIEK